MMARSSETLFKRVATLTSEELKKACSDAFCNLNGNDFSSILHSLIGKQQCELLSVQPEIAASCFTVAQLKLRLKEFKAPHDVQKKALATYASLNEVTVKEALADGFFSGYVKLFSYAFALGVDIEADDIKLPRCCENSTDAVMNFFGGPEIVESLYTVSQRKFLASLKMSPITQSFIKYAILSGNDRPARLVFKLCIEVRLKSAIVAHTFGFAGGFEVAMRDGFKMGRKFRMLGSSKLTACSRNCRKH